MDVPLNVQAALAQLCPQWQTPITTCVYLPGGYSNANYRITYQAQDYVLRLPHSNGPTERIQNEEAIRVQLAGRSRLRVTPKVASNSTQGLLLTRYCDGAVLAEEPADMAMAASFLTHLISELKPLATPQTYQVRQLANLWLPAPAAWLRPFLQLAPQMKQGLAETPERRAWQCCHNDLNPWNIIATAADEEPDQWITLDWETAMGNDPLFDVVTLYEGLCALPDYSPTMTLPDFAQAALGDRCSHAELHQMQCLFWLREYAWAQDQLNQHNTTPAIVNQTTDAEQRLRLLLK